MGLRFGRVAGTIRGVEKLQFAISDVVGWFGAWTAVSLAALALACGPRASALTAEASRGPRVGRYDCRIRDGGFDYPWFRCEVRPRGRAWWLEKIEGSQRFAGTVVRGARGRLEFSGVLHCPSGDCDAPLWGVLAPVASRQPRYHVAFIDRTTEVELRFRGPFDGADEFTRAVAPRATPHVGGASYGGAGYGGDADGLFDAWP